MYRTYLKRILDFLVAAAGLCILMPLLLVIAVLLKVVNGQVFFIQPRPGLKGKVFRVFKFCTMTDERNESGELLDDEARVTRLGAFLRKTSLDELPQLLNVVKGDMSLIGPRPQVYENLRNCSAFQQRRHEIRPGITGLAQVKGRNHLRWDHRFRYDVFYVDSHSFMLDVKILIMTVFKVLKADGVEYKGRVKDQVFTGSPKRIIHTCGTESQTEIVEQDKLYPEVDTRKAA